MGDDFTQVQIAFYPEYLNIWLRFGEPDQQLDLDRRRSLAFFRTRKVFGYVRWQANEFGTQDWHFTIVETLGSGCRLTSIEGVDPGGEVLLAVMGNTRVKRALAQIDALELREVEPAEVSPSYYRYLHNRIATGLPIRPYREPQQAAHRALQQLWL